MFSPLIEALVEALTSLPGVGRRSAQRMAFHLLERDRDGGRRLSETLVAAMDRIGRCQRCRTLSEEEVCQLCRSERRDDRLLCVVETPADVVSIEQATGFTGRYFVLMGRLSPLDGIGPAELGLEALRERLGEGVEEMIVAVNPTVEGEATVNYLNHMAAGAGVRVSRLAQGLPLGGELEYVDSNTLAHAFSTRKPIEGAQ